MKNTKPAFLLSDRSKDSYGKTKVAEREKKEAEFIGNNYLPTPDILSPDGKKEWEHVMELYQKVDAEMLSAFDENVLISYCESVAMYKQAQSLWAKARTILSTDKNQQRMLNDMQSTMNSQQRILLKTAIALGFTPTGRAILSVRKEKEKKNPLKDFLNGDDD